MNNVLNGLRVLDVSSVLAGPLTGRFLLESGATVLKVEPPGGDVTRTWRSKGEPAQVESAYYVSANQGKMVKRVDLKTEAGVHWLHEELDRTDVLLQNMKWNDLDKMGLHPTELAKKFPRLVHVRLIGSEFDADRLAYDVVVQAETGFMSMNGHPDHPPTKMPVALMDVMASHQMRTAVMAGLYQREQTGRGGYAEVSLLGSGLTALANQGTAWLMNRQIPERQGSQHPNIAPYGDLLTCRDGSLVLAVGSDAQFQALCEVLGVPALASDPRYLDNASRVFNRADLVQALNSASALLPRSELKASLLQAKVPVGSVFNVKEALEAPGVHEAYVLESGGNSSVRTSAISWSPVEDLSTATEH